MTSLNRSLRRWLWDRGWDVSRFRPATHQLARRRQLFKQYRVDLVLDVGANAGQYASALRGDVGYQGRIASFEPVQEPFRRLESAAAGDRLWQVFNMGLGSRAAEVEINIAANSFSSSLLSMLPAHTASAPDSSYVGKETIRVSTLDAVFPDLHQGAASVYLKIDTQGYERQVLDGGAVSLALIDTIQLEMSLVPLYAGEPLMTEMHDHLRSLGYRMVAVEPGFMDDASGELLQLDGIFRKTRP